MAPGKLRRVIGAVKDRTSIEITKVMSNSTTISDMEVAIVKATRHDEQHPAEERHVREILSLTCYSRANVEACVAALSRRLAKTRSWTVALKTLVLLQRLLAEGNAAYEQEIFYAARRGKRMLNMADFRDRSRSVSSWDLSAFVRTYARYLDARLEHRVQGKRAATGRATPAGLADRSGVYEVEVGDGRGLWSAAGGSGCASASAVSSRAWTPVRDVNTKQLFTRAHHLQLLLERFLACRPTGAAKTNRVVAVALFPLVKESFHLYLDLQELIDVFVDRFADMEVSDCLKVHDLFSRLSMLFDDLLFFYSWCKSAAICRPSEFPDIDRITPHKLQVMDDFIRHRSSSAAAASSDPDDSCLSIKALPAPGQPAPDEPHQSHIMTEEAQTAPLVLVKDDAEADFLNLSANVIMSAEEHGEKLALALFGCDDVMPPKPQPDAAPKWKAFDNPEKYSPSSAEDWETALMQTASSLSLQKQSPAAGIDMLLLNTMYGQPQQAAMAWTAGSGRWPVQQAATEQTMQAIQELPATVTASGLADPFAASSAFLPPAYVEMTEMERKQILLAEEQSMRQQYAQQGQIGRATMCYYSGQYHPTMGGYCKQRF